MKRFIKGSLDTIVEDNDRRIADYVANGWKEAPVEAKALDSKDAQQAQAIADANASEPKGKKKRKTATDAKVNAAIAATATADADSTVVDDGLFKKDGE